MSETPSNVEHRATESRYCALCGAPFRVPPKSPISECLPCRREEREARTDGGSGGPEAGDDTPFGEVVTGVAEDLAEIRDGGSDPETGDDTARVVLEDVAELVASDRDTHGDAVENQEHIARGWTWYLRGQGVLDDDEALTGGDVGRMMAMLKMSRTAVGSYDIDHDRDIAGYAGIAAACEFARGNVPDEDLTVSDYGDHE